jgi:hypothetical protein
MSAKALRGLVVVAVLGLTTAGGWSAAASTSTGSTQTTFANSSLSAIAATAADDVWAVGSLASKHVGLIEHWNGTKWSPTRVACHCVLNAVTARASDDVWAVGDGRQAVIEHFDGTTWTQVAVPELVHPSLQAVSADAPDDAWAVGSAGKGPDSQTLALHWDGTSWSVVSSPSLRIASSFTGVSAISPGNVLAVGWIQGGHPLLSHWNGSSWKRSQGFGTRMLAANGVGSASAHDGWAVGFGVDELGRWDGHTYTPVEAPSPGYLGWLYGVADRAAGDAWAVGTSVASSGAPHTTLIDHWDGSSWQRISSPNPLGDDWLTGVAAVAADNAWAVGSDGTGSFVLHWNGTSWN